MTDLTDDSASFDAAKFRQTLGHFPTGVTVITGMHEDKPIGMAVGSFASVSLEPPQVLFCAGRGSASWPKLRAHGSFCVNILAEDQEDISRVFASKAIDKFAEVGWRRSAHGNPLLDGVLAYVDCTLENVITSGDHDIVIGAVDQLDVLHEGGPLIFFRGGYGRFGL